MNEQKCLFKKKKKHKIWSKLTLDNYLTDQGDESEKSKKQKKGKKRPAKVSGIGGERGRLREHASLMIASRISFQAWITLRDGIFMPCGFYTLPNCVPLQICTKYQMLMKACHGDWQENIMGYLKYTTILISRKK